MRWTRLGDVYTHVVVEFMNKASRVATPKTPAKGASVVSEALWEMYEAGGDERIGALARSAAGLEADLAAYRREVEAARDALESDEKLPRWQPCSRRWLFSRFSAGVHERGPEALPRQFWLVV